MVTTWGLAGRLKPDYTIYLKDAIMKAAYSCMAKVESADFLQREIPLSNLENLPSCLCKLHITSISDKTDMGRTAKTEDGYHLLSHKTFFKMFSNSHFLEMGHSVCSLYMSVAEGDATISDNF